MQYADAFTYTNMRIYIYTPCIYIYGHASTFMNTYMRMFALDILPLHTLNTEDDNENNKENKRPPDRLRERGRGIACHLGAPMTETRMPL